MSVDPDHDPPMVQPWDIFTLAACEPLRGRPGFHIARASGKVIAEALRSYLQLDPDEMLLAVVDRSDGSRPVEGCALTTKRIVWPQKGDDLEQLPDGGDPTAMSVGFDSRSASFDEMPEVVLLTDGVEPAINLGGKRVLAPAGLDRLALGTLAGVLTTIRQALATGDLAGSVSPLDVARAARRCPAYSGKTRRSRCTPTRSSRSTPRPGPPPRACGSHGR